MNKRKKIKQIKKWFKEGKIKKLGSNCYSVPYNAFLLGITSRLVNETLENKIKTIGEAIDFLVNKDGLQVEEVNIKWKVKSNNGEEFNFSSNKELIEWAKEERDKINEINGGKER